MKYVVPPKVEKHLRRNRKMWSKKGLWLIFTYTLAVLAFGVIGKSCWDGYRRTHQWSFQTPVVIQSPIIITKLKAAIQPTKVKTSPKAELEPKLPLTEYEQVMKVPHGKILWNVYDLESQRGETDYCRLNGKGFGGFGVKDGQKPVSHIVCYETFAKAVERAEYWFARLNPDKDLATALCTWNTGHPEVNCHYYQNYLTY